MVQPRFRPEQPAAKPRAVLPAHADLLQVFARTVRNRAGKVAVEAPEGSFTYDQLDRLSNRLAHRLRALGVAPDVPVGISLPRGALELIAMLATLKAGGAYLPLDPSHPAERLQGIIQDATPPVLLTHSRTALPTSARTIFLDSIADATAGQPDQPLQLAATPEQLVYILFTSGSTGRPKGVEITRGALANFLGSMANCPGLGESDRLLAITTTSFDIAGLELFLPICVGATVVIADRETARDPRRLRHTLENSAIDMLQATPATWRLLLEAGWQGDRKLRMLCGGEALSPALADRLLDLGGELWNMYGPTETTVWSSLQRIERGYDRITIGKPIDRTQLYILDPSLRPVQTGEEGEIWIGGAGLARGYHGRPQLTAERFIQNPNGAPGDRIYRTGDLGRQLADGRFECLGRIDHQVKISGFRIELGEIETLFRRVPGVSEALVVADRHEDGDARLIAYWVGPAKRADLIAAAERSLPNYMVPAAYVALQTFPLNSNGKIDRKHLPKPDLVLSSERAPTSASGLESRISWVFSQVLGIPDIPVDQSFFTLGGTSAMALRTVARLERELGIEFSMQAFFAAPTVAGVAENLGKQFCPDAPIVARLREGKPGLPPLFCLFGVTLYQDLALGMTEDRPVFGIHIPFRYVPGKEVRPSLTKIGARYVEIIRGLQKTGPYHLLGLCFGGVVAYEVARQLQASGETVATVTIIDAVLPHGIRVNRAEQLYGILAKAWKAPGEMVNLARKHLARLLAWQPMRRLLDPSRSAQPHAIDLPVDGPDVDAEVARFAATPVKLSTRVLVVCASREPWPTYVRVAPDQGWKGWADSVVVRNVPANHLGVLRDPHVRLLAQALAEVTAD
jgi:amino acid adenylation domain-containing protein